MYPKISNSFDINVKMPNRCVTKHDEISQPPHIIAIAIIAINGGNPRRSTADCIVTYTPYISCKPVSV